MCELCEQRGKTWEGSDPTCAFVDGTFTTDNWNCATMNRLREIAEEHNWTHRDDTASASIGFIPFEGDEESGYIVLTWYKRRGQTGNAVVMWDEEPVKPLTLDLATQALKYWTPKGSEHGGPG
jgi:hypothetical protein